MPSSRKTTAKDIRRFAPGFAEEARRQSSAIAASADAEDDQAFIDSVSEIEEMWSRHKLTPGSRPQSE
ncbi:MAG: DUF3018 family protein [Alphaproteobacteria bacterium]|nr:DUF3018 family protein [Alphaproteobacteria bacterium]